MLRWQVAKIAALNISGLPGDPGAFQYLLEASYEFECFIFRRSFLDQARSLARTDRDRRAIDRSDRAILRDSWEDLAARAARLTAERESLAATIDQSGESYTKCVCGYLPEFEQCLCGHPECGVRAFEITDRKSWPVFLPLEVTGRLIEILQLDDRIRVLRQELQLRPTARERNLIGGPWV